VNLKKVMKQTFGIGGILSMMMLLSCSQMLIWAQPSLPSDERTNGKEVRAAFSAQRAAIQKCTAVIYDGSRFFNYGIVASEDGYILAKASELKERKDLSVRIGETKYVGVKVVATDPHWDVALLKVEANGLSPVVWAESSDLAQGSWVVANGASSRNLRRVNVGIISAKSREVKGNAPSVLGITFKSVKNSLEIHEVTPETGAEKAGLAAGDVIKKIGGDAVTSREALIERVRDFMAGEKVSVEFERGGEILTVEVELMARGEAYKERKSRNDQMSGDYSERRDSFPRVIQTDIPFSARNIGGPLLTLDGECIGMNIARANRAESFAIPVEEVRAVLAELMKSVE
jgi:serine protease Do